MNFVVMKSSLYKAVQKVIGVVPSKTTTPILGNILLTLRGSNLELSATDLETSVSTTLEVDGKQDGGLAVPGKFLNDIVRELPEVPIEVEATGNERLVLRTEKGTYRLAGEAKEAFPRIPIHEQNGEFTVSSSKIGRMVEKTLFAVSTDELRPNLMGVYLEVMEDQLRMVSTDGHRLAKIVHRNFGLPGQGAAAGSRRSAIIPTKALNLLLKNLEEGDSPAGQAVALSIGENHIVMRVGRTVIYSKLVEGRYPNYESVIPHDNDKELTVNRDLLASSLRRVAIFANVITHQVRFALTPTQMEITSEDPEVGAEAKEIVPVEYRGDPMVIGYNASYVLDVLRHLDTEEVVFKLKDPTSAGSIYPSTQREGEELMMLLMPIRLSEEE